MITRRKPSQQYVGQVFGSDISPKNSMLSPVDGAVAAGGFP